MLRLDTLRIRSANRGTSGRTMLAQPTTVREQIAFSYAELARAHAALDRGAREYARTHHMIRARLRRGLLDGTMKMRSFYDDERIKMTAPQACCYCGNADKLCVDHLIPQMRGGQDAPENLVWACRRCNGSKGGRDMLEWMAVRNRFPPLLLLRRYIKIVARYCEERGRLDSALDRLDDEPAMPFDVRLLPTRFPPLDELTLWIYPPGSGREEAGDCE